MIPAMIGIERIYSSTLMRMTIIHHTKFPVNTAQPTRKASSIETYIHKERLILNNRMERRLIMTAQSMLFYKALVARGYARRPKSVRMKKAITYDATTVNASINAMIISRCLLIHKYNLFIECIKYKTKYLSSQK